jgi:hypothetical protein
MGKMEEAARPGEGAGNRSQSAKRNPIPPAHDQRQAAATVALTHMHKNIDAKARVLPRATWSDEFIQTKVITFTAAASAVVVNMSYLSAIQRARPRPVERAARQTRATSKAAHTYRTTWSLLPWHAMNSDAEALLTNKDTVSTDQIHSVSFSERGR